MTGDKPREAAIPNPALKPFGILIGDWTTVGTHALLPGKVFHGRTSFHWHQGGAFLIMRSEIDEPEIPSAIGIIGSDDALGGFSMLYFDERGVSRKIETALKDRVWTWWRNAPGFSQRYTATLSDDGKTLIGKGWLSRDDVNWEGDLDLTYSRVT